LGVLERADVLGLLPDFRQTLAALEASGFYLSARLHEAALQRYRDRQGMAR
jgi:predicted nucleic acid-binding protein